MKKQKKKIKKQRLKLAALKVNPNFTHKKRSKDNNKSCKHYHLDNDGSCCHCGKLNALFSGIKN